MHNYAKVMRNLVDNVYAEATQIILIVESLDFHHGAALYKHFEPAEACRIATKVEWHYTPEHSSWLNIAECCQFTYDNVPGVYGQDAPGVYTQSVPDVYGQDVPVS